MANTKAGGEKRWMEGYPAWVAACREKHGDKYTYSPERVEVSDGHKVKIICPVHGEFLQKAAKHKAGQGCAKCAAGTNDERLAKLRSTFPDTLFPDPLPTSKEKMTLVCEEHGTFFATVNQLLATKAVAGGKACPKCNQVARGRKKRLGRDEIEKRLTDKFPTYTFALQPDVLTWDLIEYVCSHHGLKSAKVIDLLNGHGCAECAMPVRAQNVYEARKVDVDEHLAKLAEAHGGRLIFYKSDIAKTHEKVRAVCPKHGVFESMLYSLKHGHGCPSCVSRISKPEIEITKWLKSMGIKVVQQCNETLDQGTLDILLPEHRIAIEYCGLYWHSEDKRNKNYHIRKLDDAARSGVRLVTLFEDEWVHNNEVVRATILKLLGRQQDRVYARSTTVEFVTWDEVARVYDHHHLQGRGTPCADNLVLKADGKVVAAMSLKPARFGDHDVELMRYVTTCGVVGGFSKLLRTYKAKLASGTTIVSYCDKRWFTGNVYEKAGFSREADSAPGYWWCKGSKRHSRFGFQKHKLADKLKVYDEALSEDANMKANGYWKVWDCGMSKWVLIV